MHTKALVTTDKIYYCSTHKKKYRNALEKEPHTYVFMIYADDVNCQLTVELIIFSPLLKSLLERKLQYKVNLLLVSYYHVQDENYSHLPRALLTLLLAIFFIAPIHVAFDRLCCVKNLRQ